MKRILVTFLGLVIFAGLFSACGPAPITQQDLTSARQTSYNLGYQQGLAEGNSAGYGKGYSEGYTAAANSILAVWPPGYPPPVVSAPVIQK